MRLGGKRTAAIDTMDTEMLSVPFPPRRIHIQCIHGRSRLAVVYILHFTYHSQMSRIWSHSRNAF